MVIVSDSEGSDDSIPLKRPKVANKALSEEFLSSKGSTNPSSPKLDNAKLSSKPALALNSSSSSTSVNPKPSFLSRAERERLSEKQQERERRQHRQQEIEANRRRKQFLFFDPREAERLREKDERERERRFREDIRRKRLEEKNEDGTGNKNSSSDYLSAQQAAALSDVNPNVPSTARLVTEQGGSSTLRELNLLTEPTENAESGMSAAELAQVKRQYLGLREERRRMVKPSEKFRTIFNFEWDARDDTAGSNEFLAKRPDPQLLFGRGYRAGIDVREQRKTNSFYETLVSRRAEATGENLGSFLSRRDELFANADKADAKVDEEGHWTGKTLEQMTTRDWKIFREDHSIYVRGGRCPDPMRNWGEGALPLELLDAVNNAGYSKPTPVQMQAIPVAMSLRDLIASAETGSGKTAAYCLPLLAYLQHLPQLDAESAQNGPYAIILGPSRELANQIFAELEKFRHLMRHIRTCVLVGGTDAEKQAFQIRTGVELIVATPGRLADALAKQHTVLHQCNYVVLDELDVF